MLYLKNLYILHDITFGSELRKAALYVADRRVLFYLIEGDKFVLESKQVADDLLLEEEPTLDRTLALIDAFLSTIPEETMPAPNLDLSMDYTSYLLRDDELEVPVMDEAPKLKGQDLIDDFIEKAESETSMRLKVLPEDSVGEETTSASLF